MPQECIKYIQADGDALANRILSALLEASSKKNEPVKLSEITEVIYGTSEKDKQDVVRLTTEKTLIRCGIVDKIYFSERDVRYFPVAYRFQEIRRVETGAGAKIDQLVGDVVELPRDHWPVPKEYYELTTSKAACEDALAKLEVDSEQGSIGPRAYQRIREKVQKDLEDLSKNLAKYEAISELMK